MLMLVLGGIPLFGGRTLIHSHNLRSHWWDTAVSLAGPLSNFIEACVLATLLKTGIIDPYSALGMGVSYLVVLQLAAVLFNLIPFPPLDGYGAIRPHLDYEMRARLDRIGMGGYFLLLMVFFMVPGAGAALWDQAYGAAYGMGVDPISAYLGWDLSRLFGR